MNLCESTVIEEILRQLANANGCILSPKTCAVYFIYYPDEPTNKIAISNPCNEAEAKVRFEAALKTLNHYRFWDKKHGD